VVAVIAMVLGAIIVLLAIFFFSRPAHGEETKVITGSFIVSGYRSGEFAIKDEPEEMLNKGISSVKDRTKLFSCQLQLQFVCIGSADVTGAAVPNDELAAKRAKQVEAVLAANFSDAKVVSWSRGDAENIRRVRVDYKIILILSPTPVEKSVSAEGGKVFWAAGALAIGAVITLIFILLSLMKWHLKWRRKVRNLTEPEIEQLIAIGEKYSVKVEVKNGVWYSPFTSKSGTQISRDSRKKIIESLKGCLKKEEFSQQKIDLIRKGIINVTGEQ